MKKMTMALGAFLTLFIISCDGPEGPPGFDGLNGLDGLDGQDGIQGQVIEVENVNFDFIAANNLYSTIIAFEDFTNFEVLAQDAVLVYRFDGTVEFNDGGTADAWSLIPQSFFLPGGTIQYTAAHTLLDVEILIDGNFDLTNLDAEFVQDQIFRIVILPSDFATQAKIDKSNLGAVLQSLGMAEKDIKHISVN
ncbi:collagen-like protein [Spongiimicrobium sp. 3-5]|uniref:collagen-like protein n=1 Tax=Spongiimicrobium sp. 3-5 TaxID=3332596 RepID=UPI003980651F